MIALFLLGLACQTDTLVVTGVTLIDGRGGPPVPTAAVVVANGRFISVGPAAGLRIPKQARRIDGAGAFLVPGLMDANVHLVMPSGAEYLARYEDRLDALIEEAAQVALKAGLTTVFDSWGPLEALQRVRDRIAKGDIPGSRIYAAGNILGFSGPLGRDFAEPSGKTSTSTFVDRINRRWELGTGPDILWLPPDSLRTVVRSYLARKPDFLKYAVTGHLAMDLLTFSPAQQRVIVEEARRAGLVVETHTTSIASFQLAVEAGVDLMQHCTIAGPIPLPAGDLAPLIEGKVGCSIQPVTAKRLGIEVQRGLAVPAMRWGESHQAADVNERRLIAAGAPIMLATDGYVWDPDWRAATPAPFLDDASQQLGEGAFLWFQATKEKGMAPMQAILAATRNIARFYRRDDLGTVEPGKRADFLLVDADPLLDIMNLRKIRAVYKDGVAVDRASLPRQPMLTVRR